MGVKKNITKLLRNPTEMRISEIVNLLAHYGFHLARIKGSHYIIESQLKTFIIPVHNGKVTKPYLKKIKFSIETYGKKET